MNFKQFMSQLKTSPSELQFEETMAIIEVMYDFTETSFSNGNVNNETGENSGSCRLFSFAKLNNFSKEETLSCFGQYYQDVLASPDENSHQNIRQFMLMGWSGINFSQKALKLK